MTSRWCRSPPRTSGPRRLAYAVAAHAQHTRQCVTAADLYTPTVTNDAVTCLLMDLLHPLNQTGIDPGELTQPASDVYDIECTEGCDNR